MDVQHDDSDLERLEQDPGYSGGWDVKTVRQYRRLMNLIRQVPHENELRAFGSRHFEKLKGDLKGYYSMRIVDGWRLLFEIRKGNEGNCLVIKKIENYHKPKG